MLKFEQESSQKKRTLQRSGPGTSTFKIAPHSRLTYEKSPARGYRHTRPPVGWDSGRRGGAPARPGLSGLPTPVGNRALQPVRKKSGSLLKFTSSERAKEENFYRSTGGAAGTSHSTNATSPVGQKFSNKEENSAKRHKLGDAATSAVANEASQALTKEAKKSQNYAIMTADDGRVRAAGYAGTGRAVGKFHWRRRAVRVDKRQSKKAAKRLIGLEKEKLYEMRTGREAPSAIKRRRKEMKRKQIRGLAEKTLGKQKTDLLVRILHQVKAVAARVGAALFSWVGLPAIVVVVLIAVTFLLCSMLFNIVTNSAMVALSSYNSEETDIEAASLLATQLEANLEKEIAGISSAWEWGHIDEFNYYLEDVGHDPFQLMAWLSVKYPGFKVDAFSPVQLAISDLHKRRYKLELEEVVETHTDTETHTDPITGEVWEEEYEYSYYILNIYLTSRSIESAVRPLLQGDEDEDLWEWYQVLMETGGARQEFSNPFPGMDWRGYTTSLYGYRLDPIGHKNLQIHRGLDIALPTGTPITAGLTGEVTYVGYDSTFGNYIILRDDKGAELKYAHCHRTNVTRGDRVVAGETLIGTVGNTGASTGSHLHIEVKRDGKYLNPIYAIVYEEVKHETDNG